MARHHASWDPSGEGMEWINGLGVKLASDYYRRVLSRDTVTVSLEVFKEIPGSIGDPCGYVEKDQEP